MSARKAAPIEAIARDHVLVGLPDERARRVAVIEPLGDAMNDRVLERIVIEDRRHEEGGERGIAPRGFFRLDADAREHRIVAT